MDPIANMLTSIRNAQAVKAETVKVPYSKFNLNLVKVLEKHGFIKNAEPKGTSYRRVIVLTLEYDEKGTPRIRTLKRVSTPGRRMYVGYKDLHPIKSGYGMAVLSTPNGILSDTEAKKKKVGGEYICEVW
jgi:small subunit ribosomal protein S8